MSASPPDLDALLTHARWIEALGRQLCRDEHRAADGVQETWLATVRTPPVHGGNARAFLSTRLRNLLRLGARAAARRARREAEVGSRGFAEATADAVARAEFHRYLTQQVLTLPEPQRGLVLLHYWDGHPIPAVAHAAGLTVDAVHAHLKRARSTLRGRLRHGDGTARAGWALLLAATRPSIPLLALLAMKTKLAVTAAAAVAVVALAWQIGTPLASSPQANAPPATAAATIATSADTDAERSVDLGSDPTRSAVAPGNDVRALSCRLVGLHADAPWTAPVRVDLEGDDPARGRAECSILAHPGRDGAFTVALPAWTAACTAFAARFSAEPDFYEDLLVRESAASFAQSRLATTPVFELPVQVVSVLTGTVVDGRGAPVPAARVVALPTRNGVPHGGPRPWTNTAGDGSFRLAAPIATDVLVVALPMRVRDGQPGGRHEAVADANEPRDDLIGASTRTATRFGAAQDVGTLALSAAATITGEVRAGDRPEAGVAVRWYPQADATTWFAWLDTDACVVGTSGGSVFVAPRRAPPASVTDAEGRFSLAAPTGLAGSFELQVQRSCVEGFVARRQATAPEHVIVELAPTVVLQVRRGGRPVALASVRHVPMPGGSIKMTDAAGEVRFLRDRRQAAQLEVHAQGAAPVRVEVAADASPEHPIVVELDDPPRLLVRLDVEAEPFVRQIGYSLYAVGKRGVSFDGDATRPAGGGPFDLEVPPGRYRLGVLAARAGTGDDRFICRQTQGEVVVGPGATNLRARVQHGGRIAVDVRTGNGVRVGGRARLVLPNGTQIEPVFYAERSGSAGMGGLLTTEVGETTDAFAPGAYELMLDLGARGVHRRALVVRAREVTRVTLVVP